MAAVDNFLQQRSAAQVLQLDLPYENAVVVTPSDTVDLPNVARGISITAAGNVAVTLRNMTITQSVVIPLAAGINRLAVTRVWLTGTISTGTIVALW